ncbi:Na+/H+ antiporter NhaC [Anaerosinus massiliensis]|uniref:Na+/H+ antiporter NhaC n=1 Tax=Massilibacillus massiliensis TaxID=1806837 RepID=UPI000B2C29C7|nr:Na+/H+ antiporter NhaC [Massilibacillus massiliensis]
MSERKTPTVGWAIAGFILPISIILYGTVGLKAPAILSLITASVMTCVLGRFWGYTWLELKQAMLESIVRVMPAIFLLVEIGMLISMWILSGTIPMTIYWGLTLLSPNLFLLAAFFLCILTSTMTGTSFGTMGTMGIALLGIGQVLGYPLPFVVGAIVSGAYFGDKMSPISSSTYITASICEVELFTHIRSMLWTTLPAVILTAGVYSLMGKGERVEVNTGVIYILEALRMQYTLSSWALVPPVLLLGLAYRRCSPILTLFFCILAAGGVAYFFEQQEFSVMIDVMVNGYVAKTGVQELDLLLTRGGIQSVLSTIFLLIAAVSFGGVLEKIRILAVLTDAMILLAKTTGRLIVMTLFSSYAMLLGTGSQLVSIILPGRALLPVFQERGIAARVLSRTLEDGGVLAAPLVPWSVHAFYIGGILGVSAYEYAPYAILCWLVPVFSIVFGYTDIAIWQAVPYKNNKIEK